MIADDKENFVSRWSRRKSEARKTEEKPAEPKPSSAPAPAAGAVANTVAGAAPGGLASGTTPIGSHFSDCQRLFASGVRSITTATARRV